ncbi:MAG: HtrA2 peptidase [Xanthobacteraceae bacterium]|nr:HtrA2 peptidase [Xanthobacteraceae bacterium]
MTRSRGAGSGFVNDPAPVASSRLTHAVAASLAVALSVCLAATFAMLSISPLGLLPA